MSAVIHALHSPLRAGYAGPGERKKAGAFSPRLKVLHLESNPT